VGELAVFHVHHLCGVVKVIPGESETERENDSKLGGSKGGEVGPKTGLGITRELVLNKGCSL
jgi:hypothetical protein